MAKISRQRIYWTGDPVKDEPQTVFTGPLDVTEKRFNAIYKSRPSSFTHVRTDKEFKLEDTDGIDWIYTLELTSDEEADYADTPIEG